MNENYKRFYQELALHYKESKYVYLTPSGKARKKFIRGWVSQFKDGILLNVGCGDCSNIRGYEGLCVGVDIGFGNLIAAKDNIKNGIFIQGDIEKMTFFRENLFDFALVNEVLEHIYEPVTTLEHIIKALKPGGKILITCPNWRHKRPLKEKAPLVELHGISYPEKDGYLHTAYKPHELKCMAEKVGFRVLKFGSFEKEIRIWPKIVSLILMPFDPIVRKSRKLYYYRTRLESIIFEILRLTGITKVLSLFVKEGRRSYVIAEKANGN